MSDSAKYFFDEDFAGKRETEEKLKENVQSIIDLYRLLDLQDKLTVRRLIATEVLF